MRKMRNINLKVVRLIANSLSGISTLELADAYRSMKGVMEGKEEENYGDIFHCLPFLVVRYLGIIVIYAHSPSCL